MYGKNLAVAGMTGVWADDFHEIAGDSVHDAAV